MFNKPNNNGGGGLFGGGNNGGNNGGGIFGGGNNNLNGKPNSPVFQPAGGLNKNQGGNNFIGGSNHQEPCHLQDVNVSSADMLPLDSVQTI